MIPPSATAPNAGAGAGDDSPRVYIETLRDRALPLPLQRRMHTDTPCAAVYSLPTGHSPFLSAPQALAEVLARVTDAYCPGA